MAGSDGTKILQSDPNRLISTLYSRQELVGKRKHLKEQTS